VTLAVVAYGMGNIRSIVNAFDHLGHAVTVASEPGQILAAAKILLPGVGAFRQAMDRLEAGGFRAVLDEAVLGRKTPVLGICLGMQLLAATGTEGGESPGLGWIPGRVEIIPRNPPSLRLPHVGWNELRILRDCPLLSAVTGDLSMYFVHSYHLVAANPDDVTAVADYGGPIAAAVRRGQIFGFQPHPEKSQRAGLALLDRFARL
jgi:glutamine amidotransferase